MDIKRQIRNSSVFNSQDYEDRVDDLSLPSLGSNSGNSPFGRIRDDSSIYSGEGSGIGLPVIIQRNARGYIVAARPLTTGRIFTVFSQEFEASFDIESFKNKAHFGKRFNLSLEEHLYGCIVIYRIEEDGTFQYLYDPVSSEPAEGELFGRIQRFVPTRYVPIDRYYNAEEEEGVLGPISGYLLEDDASLGYGRISITYRQYPLKPEFNFCETGTGTGTGTGTEEFEEILVPVYEVIEYVVDLETSLVSDLCWLNPTEDITEDSLDVEKSLLYEFDLCIFNQRVDKMNPPKRPYVIPEGELVKVRLLGYVLKSSLVSAANGSGSNTSTGSSSGSSSGTVNETYEPGTSAVLLEGQVQIVDRTDPIGTGSPALGTGSALGTGVLTPATPSGTGGVQSCLSVPKLVQIQTRHYVTAVGSRLRSYQKLLAKDPDPEVPFRTSFTYRFVRSNDYLIPVGGICPVDDITPLHSGTGSSTATAGGTN